MEDFNRSKGNARLYCVKLHDTDNKYQKHKEKSPLRAKIIINSFIKSQASCWSLNTGRDSHRYEKVQDRRICKANPGRQYMAGISHVIRKEHHMSPLSYSILTAKFG